MSEEKKCNKFCTDTFGDEYGLCLSDGQRYCSEITNCTYRQLQQSQAENKRLREALIEIAKTEPSPLFSYSSKDIDKICIIAEQALGE